MLLYIIIGGCFISRVVVVVKSLASVAAAALRKGAARHVCRCVSFCQRLNRRNRGLVSVTDWAQELSLIKDCRD